MIFRADIQNKSFVAGWITLAGFFVLTFSVQGRDFAVDILPLLTKAGCNSGECHGAATGQGGFKLSLLGYDSVKDYQTITRDLFSRRVHLEDPAESLILKKPTRQVSHKGGRLLRTTDSDYQTLLDWIALGAPYGREDLHVTGLQIRPDKILLEQPGSAGSVQVDALLSDGSVRDVTQHALYSVQDDAIAQVLDSGQVTVLTRGLTSVMVRYSGHVGSVRVGARFIGSPSPTIAVKNNFIDHNLFNELGDLGLPASDEARPEALMRRLYLDLTGQLPPSEEVRILLSNPNPADLIENVIDDLLESDAFVDLWTYRFADLLLVSSKKQGGQGFETYHDWIKKQITDHTPVDVMVHRLLTGLGRVTETGPPNFYRLTSDPRDMGEFVSQTFLGMRLACARCHHHPFDRWSMADYYSFAAWFSDTTLENDQIVLKDRGPIEHPETRKVMEPAFPGDPSPPVIKAEDRRETLADWVVNGSNPYFSKTFVNRVWKHLMSRGLVEPVDDIRPTNPAAHPGLLDELAQEFAANGFRLRWLVKTIVSSRAYQLSSNPVPGNEKDESFFSRAYPKPLSGVVLADALAQATGVSWTFEGMPKGTRAVELPDPELESYSLDALGRCPRTDSCENPSLFGGGLPQSLHLMNDTFINQSINDGVLKQWLNSKKRDPELIENLYLRILSRYPDTPETDHWLNASLNAGDREAFFQDLFWALLNSHEFAFTP